MPNVCALLRSDQSRVVGVRGTLTLRLTVLAGLCLVNVASGAWASEEAYTRNFRVCAGDAATARAVAVRAEELRQSLAEDWLGAELPAWESPCVVYVDTSTHRVRGETTYTYRGNTIAGWRIAASGADYRILDTVLPHEVAHTVLLTHFGGPFPRWADEGAALLAESEAVRQQLWSLEATRLTAGAGASLRDLWSTAEYPEGVSDLRAFYVQGASVTEFLVTAGKPQFVSFLREGMQDGWDAAVRKHYGFESIDQLEGAWLTWLRRQRPGFAPMEGALLAEHCARAFSAEAEAALVSAQGPEAAAATGAE